MNQHNKGNANATSTPIAIVGMGCMFPKARNLKEFWRLVSHGDDAITDIPESHWSASDFFDSDPKRPDHTYAKRGGFLSPVNFDPTEFGIPPMALEATDTAQLLGLVVAKMALEDAGYTEDREFDRDKVSVILGVTGTLELVIPLGARLGHPIWKQAALEAGLPEDKAQEVVDRIGDGYVGWQENSFPGLLGNVVAGRIANRLDFGGTNCVVDAACASSLSAVHLATMELASGRSDMVLTGGIDTLNDIFMYMCFSKTPALSPTGDARPLSAQADGTMISEGLGILVMKRLEDAERDGDKIYSVIRSVGSSSDGKSQSIYAPRAAGQTKALRRAYEIAGVSPRDITLVEAHGTGTKVGDATEFEALDEVYRDESDETQWCALGTVKSQIGHTKAAAGAASLIKASLALYHKTLPPTIKVEEPNPKIDVENGPFYISRETRPWFSEGPRLAGVSALGFGGSNFHAVLEEYTPEKEQPAWDDSTTLLAFSGATSDEIVTQLKDWQAWLTDDLHPRSIARRAAISRESFSVEHKARLVLVHTYNKDLRTLLEQAEKLVSEAPNEAAKAPGLFYNGMTSSPEGPLAFVFPGQGSQYPGMSADLVRTFPECWEVMEQADEWLEEAQLTQKLYPTPTFSPDKEKAQKTDLADTAVAQPALGAVSAGMLQLLERFGLRPDVAAGHSYGELVALHAAGSLSRKDLLLLSRERGRLMSLGDKDRGTMTAVRAPLEELDALLEEAKLDVVLANRNSPKQGVLSGSEEAIAQAEELCKEKKFRARRLPVSAAFHSPLVADAKKPFRKFLSSLKVKAPAFPVYANATAEPYSDKVKAIRDLLAEQLVSPVQFVEEVEALYEAGVRVFLEVGPKAVLSGLIGAILKDKPHHVMSVDRSQGRGDGIFDLASTLAEAAVLGLPVQLHEWEEKPEEPRKPKMKIPLTGANYRSPKKTKRPPSPPYVGEAKPQSPHVSSAPKNGATNGAAARPTKNGTHSAVQTPIRQAQSVTKSAKSPTRNGVHTAAAGALQERRPISTPNPSMFVSPTPNRGKPTTMSRPDTSHDPTSPTNGISQHYQTASVQHGQVEAQPQFAPVAAQANPMLHEALQLMQHGLQAMQTLQHQTTQTHQRFLEGQEQVGLALHDMMVRSQQFVASAMQVPMPASSLPAPKAPQASTATWQTQTPTFAPVQQVAPAQPVVAPTWTAPQVAASQPAQVQQPAAPVQAAAPMNWQVPATPAAPAPAPSLSEIPTKRGATDLSMFQKSPQPAPAAPVAAPAVPAPAQPASSSAPVADVMLEVVAELTGYPVDMLDPTMDMEADLGIDSIKRVEILSTVSERVPEASDVNPEEMGRMRTLQEVIDYINQGSDAPASQAAPSVATPTPPSNGKNVEDVLVQVVADLTGYPTEMLSMDMDMEADLGIDSIKRVEILSSVTEQFPALNDVDTDMMRNLRTLGEIAKASQDALVTEGSNHPFDSSSLHHDLRAGGDIDAVRRVIKVQSSPTLPQDNLTLPKNSTVWVVGLESPLRNALVEALSRHKLKANGLTEDEALSQSDNSLVGVIQLSSTPATEQPWSTTEEDALKQAFQVAHKTLPLLQSSLAKSDAFYTTVTSMDGSFGFADALTNPLQGGLAGLPKTMQHEVEKLSCCAVDLAPGWKDWDAVAKAILQESLNHSPMEVGLSASGRRELVLEEAEAILEEPVWKAGDVVLVSGGARGVTASVMHTLAEAHLPTLVLLGRSPLPTEEPAWLQPLTAEGDIKKALFQHGWEDHKIKNPKELQRIYSTISKNREIRESLGKIKAAGSTVEYHAVDVRDLTAMSQLLDQVRKKHGPVKGLVHAAGVLEDRFIVDKTLEQFNKVFDTKVQGLKTLLQATQDDPLTGIVLFSSVSGRTGNKGQVDYAMANEVLNKVAQQQASQRQDCRVVSINWGPWDGGMVTPELKRHFTSQGITLISLESGARAFLRELSLANKDAVEVTVGTVFESMGKPEALSASEGNRLAAEGKAGVLWKDDVSLERYPVLHSHQLQGKPVVPLALIMDWMGQAVQKAYPNHHVHGYNNVRVLHGFILEDRVHSVELVAKAPEVQDNTISVELVLQGRGSDGSLKPHTRATAVLGAAPLKTAPTVPVMTGLKPYPKSTKSAYDEVLFHGKALHGITEIEGYSEQALVVTSQTAPAPLHWTPSSQVQSWQHDPLVVDDAFQVAILWAYATQGKVTLPSAFASYRQFQPSFSEETTIQFLVNAVTPYQVKGDFHFLDPQGQCIAQILGFSCTMDASLWEAFHPQTP